MIIYINFIDKFHKFISPITWKKYMILINVSIIQSCNINLNNFFETKDLLF